MSKPAKPLWLQIFEEFVRYVRINSKEVPAVDERGAPMDLWRGQKMVLDVVVKGLRDGAHVFLFGKGRQQGISTVFELLLLCWIAINPGMMAAYVCDKEENRATIRAKIAHYMKSFPQGFFGAKFVIVGNNKEFMLFSNGSRMDFIVAGIKENWGESRGYAAALLTEVSKYGKAKGLSSFRETLAENNPNSLVIYESTSNGMNHWKDMADEFARDKFGKRIGFVGWWGKELNSIKRNDPRYRVYGVADPDPVERQLMDEVEELYGIKITQEQLAWYRYKHSDTSVTIQDMNQNLPWTLRQSFVISGYSFFSMPLLEKEYERCSQITYIGYRYLIGNDFWGVVCEQITDINRKDEVVLRVWEEPKEGAYYAIGVDPAHGRDEDNDRHAISVWRCFGDKMVQVAEYADNETGTKQAAWVLAHLAGAYKNCVINVEAAPGPGGVIMNELENLRDKVRLDNRLDASADKNPNWDDFLSTARWYLYKKYDHYGGGGSVKGWESNYKTKLQLMESIRDNFTGERIIVRSVPLIKEMMSVIRKGDVIGAPESEYDDRVFGMALANRGWVQDIMMNLFAQGELYENYIAEMNGVPMDKSVKMINNMVRDFMVRAAEQADIPQMDPHQQWLLDKGFI